MLYSRRIDGGQRPLGGSGQRCGCGTRLIEPGKVLTCEAFVACITRPPMRTVSSARRRHGIMWRGPRILLSRSRDHESRGSVDDTDDANEGLP